MPETNTLVERLECLRTITDTRLENRAAGDTSHDEVTAGLGNLIAELKDLGFDDIRVCPGCGLQATELEQRKHECEALERFDR